MIFDTSRLVKVHESGVDTEWPPTVILYLAASKLQNKFNLFIIIKTFFLT
jgi:hypothetical protein